MVRPKDRPTADAPTTVAVAQSCTTRIGQSRQLEGRYGGVFGVRQARRAAVGWAKRAAEASKARLWHIWHIWWTRGAVDAGQAEQAEKTRCAYRWNRFHSRWRLHHREAHSLTRRRGWDDPGTLLANTQRGLSRSRSRSRGRDRGRGRGRGNVIGERDGRELGDSVDCG